MSQNTRLVFLSFRFSEFYFILQSVKNFTKFYKMYRILQNVQNFTEFTELQNFTVSQEKTNTINV